MQGLPLPPGFSGFENLPTGEIGLSAPEQHRPTEPATGQQTTPDLPAGRLVDLNRIPPDGTEQTLRQILLTLAHKLNCNIHAGMMSGERLVRSSSSSGEDRVTLSQKDINSAIREASKATNQMWCAIEGKQSSTLLQQMRARLNAEMIVSFGIAEESLSCGVVLIFCVKESEAQDRSKLVTQLRSELSEWIKIWYRCSRGRSLYRWLDTLHRVIRSPRTWIFVGAFTLACMIIPVPYWPKREAVLEPASRRYVASPVAGRIMDACVRPGDTVEAGQFLARIDDEKLLWELNENEAEYQQALKRRDSALAAGAAGDLRSAQLDLQRISAQMDLLESQMSQLGIVSPITGVVVSGDWVPTAGSSVERADLLFEIAPLDRMLVRVMLTTEDLGVIGLETPITLRTEAAFGQKWQGMIGRIDPRGEVENGQVCFLAETEIENDQYILRPGMRGSARMTAGYRSLGWMIFHRPYVWMMNSLAW